MDFEELGQGSPVNLKSAQDRKNLAFCRSCQKPEARSQKPGHLFPVGLLDKPPITSEWVDAKVDDLPNDSKATGIPGGGVWEGGEGH